MIHIILADAELESPKHECQHGILDQHFDRDLMLRMNEASRRGRPDITHAFLSLCQSSKANKAGKIKAWVHTRENKVLEVGKNTEIPPNYVAFLDVMCHLFSGEQVDGLKLHDMTINDLLSHLQTRSVIVLTPEGDELKLHELLENEDAAVIIGGFPEGDFRSQVYEKAIARVSLGAELLTVWSVTCEVLCSIPR